MRMIPAIARGNFRRVSLASGRDSFFLHLPPNSTSILQAIRLATNRPPGSLTFPSGVDHNGSPTDRNPRNP